jgi:hypothetical protein
MVLLPALFCASCSVTVRGEDCVITVGDRLNFGPMRAGLLAHGWWLARSVL